MQLHPELHRRYFERVAGLNSEKLGVIKPGQYQPPGEDFKPSFKQKITFFSKKVSVIVWSFDFSIANKLSTNLPFSWIQFLFFYEQMDWCISRYKSMKSVKIKTSVLSISTDWSIQSISIKSDSPILIDLSIDYSGCWVTAAKPRGARAEARAKKK